jgi:hypothetical protein
MEFQIKKLESAQRLFDEIEKGDSDSEERKWLLRYFNELLPNDLNTYIGIQDQKVMNIDHTFDVYFQIPQDLSSEEVFSTIRRIFSSLIYRSVNSKEYFLDFSVLFWCMEYFRIDPFNLTIKISDFLDRVVKNKEQPEFKNLKEEYGDFADLKALKEIFPDSSPEFLILFLGNLIYKGYLEGEYRPLPILYNELKSGVDNQLIGPLTASGVIFQRKSLKTKTTPSPTSPKIFVSYSHHDKKALEDLKRALGPKITDENLTIWDDTKIQPGQDWKEEIAKALENSTVGILLVSQDFLTSLFIKNNELPSILNKAKD